MLGAFLLISACGSSQAQDPPPVQSFFEGVITVNPEIDPTQDYSGIDVLVIQSTGREVDTLGIATTDTSGAFSMMVRAPERAAYPYVVQRRGNTLHQGELVVAEGDSASLQMELPVRGMARIRSPENDALIAYRNTMALHREAMIESVQNDFDENRMGQTIRQTSSILWDLRDSFPGSYVGDLAAVESITMLQGWNDSLAVDRATTIRPTNPRYADAVRIAREAKVNTEGVDAALDFVHTALDRAVEAQIDTEVQASLFAEIVQTYLDDLDSEKALAAANDLQSRYPDSPWADWAARAEYEAENLLPGNEAPDFDVVTTEGQSLSLANFADQPVLIEFYTPQSDLYREQVPTRNAIYNATEEQDLQIVSISLEPDTLLNEAFRDGRTLPGYHVIASEGDESPLLDTYNIASLPTRVLIDAEGRIVNKYIGTAIVALQDDIAALDPSDDPTEE